MRGRENFFFNIEQVKYLSDFSERLRLSFYHIERQKNIFRFLAVARNDMPCRHMRVTIVMMGLSLVLFEFIPSY